MDAEPRSQRGLAPVATRPATCRLLEAMRATGLLQEGDRVLVGVSGGPDSLVLLHALTVGSAVPRLQVVVAHLHHSLRQAEADADVAFVLATAASWGVPAVAARQDIRARARRTHVSIETAGREARYEFFRHAAAHYGCGKVALAHTADDQAETVLLNLLRGAGLEGLSGMPARRSLDGPHGPELVRPLLQVWRADILRYVAENGLQPREDVENRLLRYRRNRVRQRLIPLLEQEFNPRIREHLVRLAALVAEENQFLEEQATALRERLSTPAKEGVALDAVGLAAAPAVLARRVLRQAIRDFAGLQAEIDRALIERLLSLARGAVTTGFPLPGAPVRAARRAGVLVLEPLAPPQAAPVPGERPLAVPGVASLPGLEGEVIAGRVPLPACLDAGPDVGYLDAARLSDGLTLRTWRLGDRFEPLGAPGGRKLSDVFIDRKLPRNLRRRLPVVVDAERIVWVAGVGISEAVRLRPETREVVRLEWCHPPAENAERGE